MKTGMHWFSAIGMDGQPVQRTKEDCPYSYDAFRVFDSGKEAKSGVYSDRLYQWDSKKYNALCRKHFGDEGQTFYLQSRPTKKIEMFLADYFDGYKELQLTRIYEGCNVGNGFPYWYFEFTYTAEEVAA